MDSVCLCALLDTSRVFSAPVSLMKEFRFCGETYRALHLNLIEISCGKKWVTDMGMICVERTNQTDLPKNWLGKVAWNRCNQQRRAGTGGPKVQTVLVTNPY